MPAYWSVSSYTSLSLLIACPFFPRRVQQHPFSRAPCFVLQGSSVPSGIVRTNRAGGGVGSSPGINPITPYTTASLDYRASWIAGEMVANTKVREISVPRAAIFFSTRAAVLGRWS